MFKFKKPLPPIPVKQFFNDKDPAGLKKTIVDDTSESRIEALKADARSFFNHEPSRQELLAEFNEKEEDLDDFHGYQVRWMLARKAKLHALFPEYNVSVPCLGMDEAQGIEKFWTEEGRLRNDRQTVINAALTNRHTLKWAHERFQSDAEILLCSVLNNNFSFMGANCYMVTSKYDFISEDMFDGNCYSEIEAEPLERLYQIVKAERPIKAFYELLRPQLRMIYPSIDRRSKDAFDTVCNLPNFNTVMDECLEHEAQKLKDNYTKLRPQFLADKLENALPLKPNTKTNPLKI